jgi:hypothetical protein
VLFRRGAVCLIDLGEFGRVQVPMFDAFHLLSDSRHWALRPSSAAVKGRPADPATAIVREYAAHLGLDAAQSVAAYFYYLMSLAAFRLRPGVNPAFRDPCIRDLIEVVELRRQGIDFQAWLRPGAG